MTSKRDLIRENKRTLLRLLVAELRDRQAGLGPHALTASEQLVTEFTARARLESDGPPPGHPALPGLERPMAAEIKVGDMIRHTSAPLGQMEATVLEVSPTCDDGSAEHPSYRILDPQSGSPDWVCSREFVRVGR